MIYLTTGANGAGKTLLTIYDVRQQQLKENRPVYYHGFDMDEAKAAEFGWQKFEPAKWQDLPDGSICIMDECQNEFPLRRSGSEVPDYINAIAQHRRRRGFDFWLIAPHPMLLDVFVRRLIASPSWHRHLKRTFGGDMVSVLKFNSPDLKCEEQGAAARAEVSMRAFPKEAYGWYRSASIHTAKRKLPRALFVLVGAALAVPLLGYLGFSYMKRGAGGDDSAPVATSAAPVAASSSFDASPAAGAPGGAPAAPMTAEEYVSYRAPRLPDFPHTAPAYDRVTEPVRAPFPAACIVMASKGCACFSQQGTRLAGVGDSVCRQIVAHGFFMDWDNERGEPQREAPPVASPGTLVLESNGDPRAGQGYGAARPMSTSPRPVPVDGRVSASDVAARYRAPGGRLDPMAGMGPL